MQAQAEANAQAQQVAAQLEVQKQQALTNSQIQLEQAKSSLGTQRLKEEANLKKELMSYEFQINMALKQKEAEIYKNKEGFKEDRKDNRTKIQASQQSQLIEQRQKNTGAKDFESSGNDILSGDFDLGSFEPR